MIMTKQSQERLHVDMTTQERADMGASIARRVNEIAKLEDAKKAASDGFRSKIDRISEELTEYAAQLELGQVERLVPVRVEFDYARGIVTVRRNDNDQTVRSRVLSVEERQQQFEFDAKREPAKLFSIEGKVYDLKDERTAEQRLEQDGQVELQAPTDGVRADAPSVDDDIPFGGDAPTPEPARPMPEVGSWVWLDNGKGMGVGPKMRVESVRQSAQKGEAWIGCSWLVEGSPYDQSIRLSLLTTTAPVDGEQPKPLTAAEVDKGTKKLAAALKRAEPKAKRARK